MGGLFCRNWEGLATYDDDDGDLCRQCVFVYVYLSHSV